MEREHIVTPEILEQVKTLRNVGHNWNEIANELGFHRITLWKALDDDTQRKRRRGTRVTAEEKQRIFAMRAEGCPVRDISAELGLCRHAVARVLGTRMYRNPYIAKERPLPTTEATGAVEISVPPKSYWLDGWMIAPPTRERLMAGR